MITVYPQHEVLKDLIELRLSTGRPLLFDTRVTALDDVTDRPRLKIETKDGRIDEIVCDIVVACDGGHSIGRRAIPEGSVRHDFTRVYRSAGSASCARPSHRRTNSSTAIIRAAFP